MSAQPHMHHGELSALGITGGFMILVISMSLLIFAFGTRTSHHAPPQAAS